MISDSYERGGGKTVRKNSRYSFLRSLAQRKSVFLIPLDCKEAKLKKENSKRKGKKGFPRIS